MNASIRKFLKNILSHLNRGLKVFGFMLISVNGSLRTFDEFCQFLRSLGFHPALVIDVGVCRGTPQLYTAFPSAKFILVEPQAEFEPVLQRLTETLDAEYHLCAVAEGEGEIEFHVHSENMSGSSILREVGGEFFDGSLRKVKTVPLDRLLPDKITGTALLKIDVQGGELSVLKGTESHLSDIDVIVVETSLISNMKGGAEIRDITNYLHDRGFVIFDVINPTFRPLDRCLQEVDLVFVRENSSLRRDHRFATQEQRVGLDKRMPKDLKEETYVRSE
jgi:FkbM family methyltransferase